MVQEKQMNEEGYEGIVKDLTTSAEMIKTHQNEKQSVANAFEKEKQRFQQGIISKIALKASVPQVQKTLNELDHAIRENIERIKHVAVRIGQFAASQSPKAFHVDLGGVEGSHHANKAHKHHSHHKRHHKKRK